MNDNDLYKLKSEEIKILDYFVDICDKNNLHYYLMYGTLLGAVRHKGFIPWDDDIDVCMPPEDYQQFLRIFKNDDRFFLQTVQTDKYYHTLFAKIRENHTCMIEKENTYMPIHKGINIDIFPLIPYPEEHRRMFILKFKLASLLVSKNLKTNNLKNKIIFTLLKIIPRKITNDWTVKIMNSLLDYSGNYSQYKMEINDQPLNKEWFYPHKMVDFEGKKYASPNECEKVLEKLYGNFMQLPPESERVGHGYGNIILSFDKSFEELTEADK